MYLFCYYDVKQTRFKIELIKINTTNYYISVPFIEGCFIDLKTDASDAFVLNKSGFTQ